MEISYKVHKLVFLMDKMADQALQQLVGISYSQFLIVMAIKNNPKVSQKEIAKSLNITEAAVSRHIETLREKKLVKRAENKQNRREHILSVTDKGLEIFLQAVRVVNGRFDDLFKALHQTDQTHFETCTDALLANIDTENRIIGCKGNQACDEIGKTDMTV